MKTIRLIIVFTVLLLALHSGVEAADTTPPEIGAITGGGGYSCCMPGCIYTIVIIDNEAVDLECATVVVRDEKTGEDITATLTRANFKRRNP